MGLHCVQLPYTELLGAWVVPLHSEHLPVPPHSLHSGPGGCSPVPRQTGHTPELLPSGRRHIGQVLGTQLLGATVVPKHSEHFLLPPHPLQRVIESRAP